MTEDINRPADTQKPVRTRDQIFAIVLLVALIVGVIVPLAYFLYTVVLPGIAAGFAQFSLTGGSLSGPLYP